MYASLIFKTRINLILRDSIDSQFQSEPIKEIITKSVNGIDSAILWIISKFPMIKNSETYKSSNKTRLRTRY